MSNSDYMEFGFGSGDEKISGGKFERFKGKENENYRVSFIWWPRENGILKLDAASPRFVGAKRFYIPNAGYILDNGPEFAKIAGGPSKATIATIIALWPVDRKGGLDKGRFMTGDVDVKPWIFSKQTYEQLKRRHEEFPFGQHDVGIACTDTQFQKMDLSPCKESLFRKVLENDKMKNVQDIVLSKIAEIEPQIQTMICQNMPLDKLREKLGLSTGGGTGGYSPDTTSKVDDILDDLLD